jgi:hypothetical protein
MNAKPISDDSKTTRKQTGCFVVSGLVFFGAGIAMLVGFQLLDWLSCRSAADWPGVPCTIVSSTVQEHRGDDSTSYSVEARFTYEVDQQKFTADQYDFNTSRRARKKCKEIVRQIPAGTKTVCFVDPDDPENAVLNKEFLLSWLELAMGLVFSAVGLAIAIGLPLAASRQNKQKRTVDGSIVSTDDRLASLGGNPRAMSVEGSQSAEGKSSGLYQEDIEDQKWDVPQRLKPTSTKFVLLLITIGVALFWNGIVSVFLWQAIMEPAGAISSTFLLLFMIPFVLVGLVLILDVVRSFLSLFNPVFQIAMSTGAVGRGNTVDVAWEIKGSAKRIDRLRIAVVGTETARYLQGTSTVTDTSHFGLITVVDTDDAEEISFGSSAVTIPTDAMHTFADRHNQVTWAIQVRGEIARWPDVLQQHKFRVKP